MSAIVRAFVDPPTARRRQLCHSPRTRQAAVVDPVGSGSSPDERSGQIRLRRDHRRGKRQDRAGRGAQRNRACRLADPDQDGGRADRPQARAVLAAHGAVGAGRADRASGAGARGRRAAAAAGAGPPGRGQPAAQAVLGPGQRGAGAGRIGHRRRRPPAFGRRGGRGDRGMSHGSGGGARSASSVSHKDALARTITKTRRGAITGLAGSVASVSVFGGAFCWPRGCSRWPWPRWRRSSRWPARRSWWPRGFS